MEPSLDPTKKHEAQPVPPEEVKAPAVWPEPTVKLTPEEEAELWKPEDDDQKTGHWN